MYDKHFAMLETFSASLFMSFVLSHADYARPTPPRKSGFHRYQFMLFEQPPQARVTLTEQEKSLRGNASTTQLAAAVSSIMHQQ